MEMPTRVGYFILTEEREVANEIEMYALALANEIAVFAHRRIFWDTPYRTGALARGISNVGAIPNGAGFSLLTQHTQYGAILNELPVIKYSLTNKKTGKVYKGEYDNIHYKWIDRAAENIAIDIPVNFPNVKRTI